MKELHLASFGGGVNSTALIIELTNQGVKFDFILFADTGGEKPETYAFVKRFSDWLVKHGQPAITTVKKVTKDGEPETLEEYCLKMNILPPIAYGFKHCSQKYKIQPVEKWCNNNEACKELWKEGGKIIKYIGFDVGERHRIKIHSDAKYEYKYPLVEWMWTRNKCREVIVQAGLCLPPKSSCFFCPNMKAGEILALPEDLQKRAIAMEQGANLVELKGLGRDYSWESLINADEKQQKLFEDLEMFQPPCECID